MNFLFFPLTSFLTAAASVAVLKKFSEKTGFLVDVPEGDFLKIHTQKIPLIGGLAILISSAINLSFVLLKYQDFKIIALLFGVAVVFALGFWDDLKWKHITTIKPFIKFALLIVATLIPAITLFFVGITFNFLPYYAISVLLSFFYIFLVINSVNYQDGIDGLAGGLVFISLAGFFVLSVFLNNFFAIYISLIFLGVVLAFLVFNFPPAKIFMGDSGAYVLGFILAILAMVFSKPFNIYSALGPAFIIGLPIFDGIYTNIRRLLLGKSIFFGDRSHFYDKLIQKGFSVKKTLAICYSLQIVFVILGILIYK